MGYIVTLGKNIANKKADATVKYYGGKLGNTLPTFSTPRPPYAGNNGKTQTTIHHGKQQNQRKYRHITKGGENCITIKPRTRVMVSV